MEKINPEIFLGDVNITKDNYHELLTKWIEQMKPYKNPELKFISSNSELLDFNYDNKDYSVTDNDVDRTRNVETMNYPDFQKYLKQLLVFYCEKNGVKYKQGLNEIMGIFLLMKFFDEKFSDVSYRMRVLKMFPEDIQRGYALYKKNQLPPDF
jgi:hypothetical protein